MNVQKVYRAKLGLNDFQQKIDLRNRRGKKSTSIPWPDRDNVLILLENHPKRQKKNKICGVGKGVKLKRWQVDTG